MKQVALLLVLFALSACTKEVARRHYLLKLNFDNGIKHESDGRIFEKDKEYKKKHTYDIDDHVDMGIYPDAIYFYANDGIQVYLFKTKEEKLVGTITQLLHVTGGSSVLGNDTGNLIGNLELQGAYKSPWRKITVKNGTFTFQWSNAEDFGLTDTTLTGTWTLKRK